MKKRYLITGGTGFIGSALVQEWLTQNIDVTVLTRNPEKARQRWNGRVTAIKDLHEAAGEFEVLVNLAGEGIADARWSPERKRLLEQSRIDLTNSLAIWAVETGRRFGAFLSGSAIGYYGSCLPTAQKTCPTHTEASPSGEDYAARLCQRWEEAAGSLSGLCDRTMILRTGVVLGQNGGMLKRLWL
ncbi:MAG: NAD-dependent epimerase/dehydratase family protein, partial [Oceanobacter sp.]